MYFLMRSGLISNLRTGEGFKRILLLRSLFLGVILLCWEILGRTNGPSAFFISRPSQIYLAFIDLIISGNFFIHFFTTASEAFVGFTLGTIIGAGIGLLLWNSSIIARTVQPFVLIAGSVPLVALAPLFIVWFGVGFTMKAALAFFSTVFPALAQSYRGALSVNSEFSDVLKAMKATRNSIFFKVIIPGSLNWVLGSMRLNIGFGLLGAFLGEFIASQSGLGYVILRASSLYNVPQALAASVGIAILALLFDRLGSIVEKNSILIIQCISVPRLAWSRIPVIQ